MASRSKIWILCLTKGIGAAAKTPSNQELQLLPRRGGLKSDLTAQLKRAAESWLLLGSIGQRSNRAAGSIFWDKCPSSQKHFELTASEILQGSSISFAVLDRVFENDLEARDIAGDFLSDRAFHGTAPFGAASPRKSSPLKLKCVALDNQIKLLAIWDHRNESPNNLQAGIQKLVQANKPIGHLLHSAFSRLINQH